MVTLAICDTDKFDLQTKRTATLALASPPTLLRPPHAAASSTMRKMMTM